METETEMVTERDESLLEAMEETLGSTPDHNSTYVVDLHQSFDVSLPVATLNQLMKGMLILFFLINIKKRYGVNV